MTRYDQFSLQMQADLFIYKYMQIIVTQYDIWLNDEGAYVENHSDHYGLLFTKWSSKGIYTYI